MYTIQTIHCTFTAPQVAGILPSTDYSQPRRPKLFSLAIATATAEVTFDCHGTRRNPCHLWGSDIDHEAIHLQLHLFAGVLLAGVGSVLMVPGPRET